MKPSPIGRARKLRLEAAEGPRVDISGPTRREKDLLGERDVPATALYGIQTLRAMENFCITGIELREFPTFVAALATVKEGAALANLEMKLIDREIVDAICQAAGEIREGLHHDHFRVDMIQGGAGTSSNMNVNEVMANRALEILGKERGDYDVVHPNNHLNLSQSTNDVYPTAVKLALHTSISDLQLAMIALAAAFLHKGEEFGSYIKMGRTQLQDAVPMTLGQEFNAFAHTMLEDVDRLGEAQALIREINMPRRIYTYDAGQGWDLYNAMSTAGAMIFPIAMLIFIYNFFKSRKSGEIAGANPWGAGTLEWTIPSPPPEYNFAKIPTVTTRYPLWEGKEADHESARINAQEGKTPHDLGIVMPFSTIKPLFVALGLVVMFCGLIWTRALIGIGAAIMILSLYSWLLSPLEPEHH